MNDEHRTDTLGEGKLLQGAAANESAPPPNKRQKVEPAVSEKIAVDFFGRPIIKTSAAGSRETDAAKAFSVAYRFKEGNSAAVRKPIKIEAFL